MRISHIYCNTKCQIILSSESWNVDHFFLLSKGMSLKLSDENYLFHMPKMTSNRLVTVPSNQKCEISTGFMRMKYKMIETQLKCHRQNALKLADMPHRKKSHKPI